VTDVSTVLIVNKVSECARDVSLFFPCDTSKTYKFSEIQLTNPATPGFGKSKSSIALTTLIIRTVWCHAKCNDDNKKMFSNEEIIQILVSTRE